MAEETEKERKKSRRINTTIAVALLGLAASGIGGALSYWQAMSVPRKNLETRLIVHSLIEDPSATKKDILKRLVFLDKLDLIDVDKKGIKYYEDNPDELPRFNASVLEATAPVPANDSKEAQVEKASAREWELAGFNAIIDRDADQAIASFGMAADAWPDYHNVDEIHRLLERNQASLAQADRAERAWQNIAAEIVDKYLWRAPMSIKIWAAQELLADYDGKADGRSSDAFADAIRSFQRSKSIKADGVVGPATLKLLAADWRARPELYFPE